MCLSTVISVEKPLGPSAPGWERRALAGTFLQGTLPPSVMVLGDWGGTEGDGPFLPGKDNNTLPNGQ